MNSFLIASLLSALCANAQLTGPVGPTTPLSLKTHQCNILDYGAKNENSTNVVDVIGKTCKSCVLHTPANRLVVPGGNYLIKRSVMLANGTNWATQLDGIITLAYCGN